MVRIPSGSDRQEADMDSTMTPMIDVVFLLLIFFVWTAGTQVVEYLLPGELSSQQGSEPTEVVDIPPELDFDRVVIRLRWDDGLPDWSINDQPMESLADVVTMLETLADINPEAPIVIHPDPDVPLGHVIELFDASRVAGFPRVSFAVNGPRSD